MKTRLAFLILIVFVLALCAPNAAAQHSLMATWQHSQYYDPIAAKTFDKFTVEGEYLQAPRVIGLPTENSNVPRLVVVCSGGKVVKQYGIVRSVLWSPYAHIDYRIADKKKTVTGDVMTTKDALFTGDEAKHTYSLFGLKAVLLPLLHAQDIVMSLRGPSTTSINSTAGPADPMIIMRFEIPSPSKLFAVCNIKP